ncbi:MAG: hypothetical protein GX442_10450 [Candidatus Riflebacteria bacterium]|nr:hypothetical protein [Candidatus Riflebacteria bacterium]
MEELERLIDKIRKIQALHDGAATSGERAAAAAALGRLQESLGRLGGGGGGHAQSRHGTGAGDTGWTRGRSWTAPPPPPPEREKEYQFTLDNPWSYQLALALLRKAGLRPYRRKGQRRTTVMARMRPSYFEEVFAPEFRKIDHLLYEYLTATADRVISEAIGAFDAHVGEV